MKKYICLLILVFGTFNAWSRRPPVELLLPNSNKIVVKFMFKNGSISDVQGKEGITKLTASLMMDGGTGEYTSANIKDKTYPWAANWYVTVDKEVCVFTFEFHKDHQLLFTPIMLGLITKPHLSKDDFNRIKSNQENYVNEVIRSSSDEDFSKMGLEDLLFRGTNYQHMVHGTSAGLKAITIEDVLSHYKNVFTQQTAMIGIAGNYSSEFVSQLSKGLEVLPKTGTVIPEPGMANKPQGFEIEIVSKKNALGSAIFTGYPLQITRADDDFAALMIANSWLGEHRKSYSQLYKKIRQERSMNYGDYSYIEWYHNGGSNMLPPPGFPRSSNYFAIWIRPVQTAEGLKKQYPELSELVTGHAPFALKLAITEFNKLFKNGLTNEEFELTREFLISYMKLYIQTPERQLGFLMDSRFYGRKDYINEMDGLLSAVTLEQVNFALKNYLNPKAMYVCIVTDDSEAEALKEALLNNDNNQMSYSNDLRESLSPEILAEDEEIDRRNLRIEKVTIISSDDLFRK